MTAWRGEYYTGAQWREPAGIHLPGRAPTRDAADLQLRVVGTVRFPGGA